MKRKTSWVTNKKWNDGEQATWQDDVDDEIQRFTVEMNNEFNLRILDVRFQVVDHVVLLNARRQQVPNSFATNTSLQVSKRIN